MKIITIPTTQNRNSLNFGDMLIYGTIKAMTFNGQALITNSKIIEKLNITNPTFSSAVKRLKSAGLLKTNTNKQYIFADFQETEKFSCDFILSDDISNDEKEFLIRIQNLLFGKSYNPALVNKSTAELAEYCNVSLNKLYKIKRSLEDKHIINKNSSKSFCIDTKLSGQFEVLKDEKDAISEGLLAMLNPDADVNFLKTIISMLVSELQRTKDLLLSLEG